jgi:sulfide:quinone oxidoreductase
MDALKDPNCPAGSMYIEPFAWKMRRLREEFKGGEAHFTVAKFPIKCGGAPQKILYLSEETFRKNGVRDKSNVHFHSSLPGMFPVPLYSDSLDKIAKSKGIIQHFKSVLTSVDKDNRTATFTNGDGE